MTSEDGVGQQRRHHKTGCTPSVRFVWAARRYCRRQISGCWSSTVFDIPGVWMTPAFVRGSASVASLPLPSSAPLSVYRTWSPG